MAKATLTRVEINKYKSIETPQAFDIDKRVTTLVGKNESGKSAVLEAMAKTRYFEKDDKFTFDAVTDYPRRQKKKFDKAGEAVTVATCTYKLSDDLLSAIQEDIGPDAFKVDTISYSTSFKPGGKVGGSWGGVTANLSEFLRYKLDNYEAKDESLTSSLMAIESTQDLDSLKKELEDHAEFLESLRKYFKNEWSWPNPISEYVARHWIDPALPKFMYYSDFYTLPSEVEIRKLQQSKLEEGKLKTSKALFELADINIDDLLDDDNYEAYKAELEATSNEITQTLFHYWKTNPNLRVEFDIQKQVERIGHNQTDVNPVLKIRVWNQKYMMSLPLDSRSKGFNWFFSFIVWFSKIQEDRDRDYILLLDEPGLNLHATAQDDLLRFIEDLSKGEGASDKAYQVIYSTHSPFMVDSSRLERVRTIVETDKGTKISESIQEKDPETLFPLQAALGYDLAQNLFVSKNNLLIEGPSDLLYLEIVSEHLKSLGRTGLDEGITLVPVGGLDKVGAFISLLRGQKLNIACLLDSFDDQKGKARLDDLVKHKIIKQSNVCFYHDFLQQKKADVEDLFEPSEYLDLFNAAFHEHKNLTQADLSPKKERMVERVADALGLKRYNHYRPALRLAKLGVESASLSDSTLERFERVFEAINRLF